MKHIPIISLFISLLFAGTVFAADASVHFTHSTNTDSITVNYVFDGSNTEVDQICLILEYEDTGGFFTFAPENDEEHQVECFDPQSGTFTFTGLQPETTYWISSYPFKEIETPSDWTWANSDTLLQIAGGGIGGREVQTQKEQVAEPSGPRATVKTTHSATVNSITVNYTYSGPGPDTRDNTRVDQLCLVLDYDSTDGFYTFAPERNSRRQVKCADPQNGSYTFTGLQPDTSYWLSAYPYIWTATGKVQVNGGGIGGREIRTQGTASNEGQNTPSYNPTPTTTDLPPAGYEDEVLVNMDAYNNPFPDTSVANLSGKAAAELYRRAVIGGYPDGEFKGYRDVNRAEAAKFLLLARYGNVNDVRNSGRFPDVLDGQWYTKYVVTAADKGIISGHPDGTFRPADTVNTAEFLKMLSLTFGLQLNLQYSYADVTPQDWFAQYVGIAKKYDLFPGRSTYLQPGDPLTREEVTVAIYQYLQNR